jgi:hypothetical protein
MSNPSTIWTQLSVPNPPIGSIPYVDTDGATIVTDVTHFYYTATTTSLFVTSIKVGYASNTTPGSSVACNATSGRVQMSSGRTTLTVTNTFVTAASVITVVSESNDSTALYVRSVVPGAGQFIITVGPANSTAVMNFSFMVINN